MSTEVDKDVHVLDMAVDETALDRAEQSDCHGVVDRVDADVRPPTNHFSSIYFPRRTRQQDASPLATVRQPESYLLINREKDKG